MEDFNADMLRRLQANFRNVLKEFDQSSDTFRIIQSIPDVPDQPRHRQQRQANVRTLYVLDSSFNPPSKAHLLLAQNALRNDDGPKPWRVLLLLATENADKKYKPATNEDRLVMMALMARSLYRSLDDLSIDNEDDRPTIDVGVTKKPFFVDKASSIDRSAVYGPDAEQVHVTGFDTIVRIFDPKYYPADVGLRCLDPFLNRHRLRVTYRVGDDGKYGTADEQRRYVDGIGDGSREKEGMRSEWRSRVDLVDDARDGEGVSSTQARLACVEGRHGDLERFVVPEVAEYVRLMDLYREPGAEKK